MKQILEALNRSYFYSSLIYFIGLIFTHVLWSVYGHIPTQLDKNCLPTSMVTSVTSSIMLFSSIVVSTLLLLSVTDYILTRS